MSQLVLAPQPQVPSTGGPDVHVTCCDDHDVALCGRDLTGMRAVRLIEVSCVVCRELHEQEEVGFADEPCRVCPLSMARE